MEYVSGKFTYTSGEYHVHLKKQRLLAGAKTWYHAGTEQQEPLNLTVNKNNEITPHSCTNSPYKHFKKRKLLQELEDHKERISKRRHFTCKYCSFQTTNKREYQEHLKERQHTSRKKSLECKTCGRYVASCNKQSESEKVVAKKYCRKCEAAKRFSLKKKRKIDNVSTHQCGNCEYNTVVIEAFEEHLRKHADEEPFRCSFCTFETPWKTEFNYHLDQHYRFGAAVKNHMLLSV